ARPGAGRVRRLLLSLLCGAGYVAFSLDSPIFPAVILIALAGAILLWTNPKVSLYIVLAATCLFEMARVPYSDSLTDQVPFFWNINTIIQTYAHANFKAIPLNLLEVILLVAGGASLLRAVVLNQMNIRVGPLFLPIFVYLCFVSLAWFNGMVTGGDFKLSLQEVRAQFYLLFAYLMAINIVKTPQQTLRVIWITVLCVGLKGILYTFRRYVTIAGMPLPDQGVGSHEEAFFFDAFAVLLATLILCGEQGRLQRLMWFLLPLVVLGNLATNRRAATAAMVVVVPIMLMAAFRALPERRKLVVIFGAILSVGFSIYYPAFKNSQSAIAQPARAIKSNFQPDERDASSNLYRDAENANIMATLRLNPVLGYGYGKRMLHAVPIADISQQYEWWDLLPHNQILWVWMRTGSLGFVAFWMMISSILIFICRVLRSRDASNLAKAVGIFTILIVAMLMIFGLLDLQISNFRDMLFVGFWIGIAAGLPEWKRNGETEDTEETPAHLSRVIPSAPIAATSGGLHQ
ncbi:MAG: O-antigen ligase family protein, partial [Armatimonadota bacterium]